MLTTLKKCTSTFSTLKHFFYVEKKAQKHFFYVEKMHFCRKSAKNVGKSEHYHNPNHIIFWGSRKSAFEHFFYVEKVLAHFFYGNAGDISTKFTMWVATSLQNMSLTLTQPQLCPQSSPNPDPQCQPGMHYDKQQIS